MENVHEVVNELLDGDITDLMDGNTIQLTGFADEVCHELFSMPMGSLGDTERVEFLDAVREALDEEDREYE